MRLSEAVAFLQRNTYILHENSSNWDMYTDDPALWENCPTLETFLEAHSMLD